MRAVLATVILLCASPAQADTTYSHTTISVDGRDIILHHPVLHNNALNKPLPALLVLHGGLGNAQYMDNKLGLDHLANEHGFIVAYLNGTEGDRAVMKNRRVWNAGTCCGIAVRRNIDDVKFIDDVIDSLVKKAGADSKNIFLMGHSNGAMMSYRYVCERPGKIKGAVTVSGTLLLNQCPAGNNTHILHIHGQHDNSVPVAGGQGDNSLTQVHFRSVAGSADIMEKSGAEVQTILLQNAGHALSDINMQIKELNSISLQQTIADMISLLRNDNTGHK